MKPGITILPRASMGAGRVQVPADLQDFLSLDQHVALVEVAHVRVHRHYGPAADDVAAAGLAAVAR
jgi:hypothetical protein